MAEVARPAGLVGHHLRRDARVRPEGHAVARPVRFLTGVYGVRGLKDEMSREALTALDEAGIGVASATYEITGVPPLKVTGGP